jgi:hypothetical protein
MLHYQMSQPEKWIFFIRRRVAEGARACQPSGAAPQLETIRPFAPYSIRFVLPGIFPGYSKNNFRVILYTNDVPTAGKAHQKHSGCVVYPETALLLAGQTYSCIQTTPCSAA